MVGNGIIRRDATGPVLCNAWSGAANGTAVTLTRTRKAGDYPFVWPVKFQPWKSPRLWWSPNWVTLVVCTAQAVVLTTRGATQTNSRSPAASTGGIFCLPLADYINPHVS